MECVVCYELVEQNCSTCLHPYHAKCAARQLQFRPDWNKRCLVCGLGECVFDAPAAPPRNPLVGTIPPELAGIEGLKTCPGCGTGVMKNGGCDFIRCRCGVSFRWSNRKIGNEFTPILLLLGLWPLALLFLFACIELNNDVIGSCVSRQPSVGQFCTAEEEELRLQYQATRLECVRQEEVAYKDFRRFESHFPALREMYLDKIDALRSSCHDQLRQIDRSRSIGRIVVSVYRLVSPPFRAYLTFVRWFAHTMFWLCESILSVFIPSNLAHCATQRIFIAVSLNGLLDMYRQYA